jgi:hypothetical protein
MACSVLQHGVMDRKRSDSGRPGPVDPPPSPEDIQATVDQMAGAIRGLQNDVDALLKRPNVLPWRRKPTDDEEKEPSK